MKIRNICSAMIILATVFSLTACGGGGGGGGSGSTVTFDNADTPGDIVPIAVGSETVDVVYANSSSTVITFPMDTSDSTTGTISAKFFISETEVTYAVWKTVHTWATDAAARGANVYTFANAGREGHDGTIGAVPTSAKQEPVTTISWRDAMIWCNALTEYYNANGGSPALVCVYNLADGTTPIRSCDNGAVTATTQLLGGEDNPNINSSAKGFRLPTSNEWEYAARYRGTDTTNVVTGTISGTNFSTMTTKWTKGNSASGDTQAYNAATPTVGNYAVYSVNSGSSTAAVKSKTANTLGLYDMSGNVWEWCFDWYTSGSYRVTRGDGWLNSAFYLQAGGMDNDYPWDAYHVLGFRFARNK